MGMLVFIFVARVITTLLWLLFRRAGRNSCPDAGAGTVLGTAFGMVAVQLFPDHLEAGRLLLPEWGCYRRHLFARR